MRRGIEVSNEQTVLLSRLSLVKTVGYLSQSCNVLVLTNFLFFYWLN